VALAAEGPAGDSEAARRRHEAHAVQQVAHQLGNTPAVARRAYVDPRVVASYENGATVDLDDTDADDTFEAVDDIEDVEAAVIELIEDA
jgi:DNA topoisomerase IB